MANISWSLIVPTLIALLCVNAVITICISSLKDVDGKHRAGNIAIAVGAVLVFLSLFCVLVWLMYSTPARFLFETIDRLINGVVSGLPRFLLILWFILPLAITYMIYAFMATFYERRKRQEYILAEKSKKEESKKSEEKTTTQKSKPSVTKILEKFVTTNDIEKAIDFRRFINAEAGQVTGVKYREHYWLVAHNEDEFNELKQMLPDLLSGTSADGFPTIINATQDTISVTTEQHAINAFRKLTRKVD